MWRVSLDRVVAHGWLGRQLILQANGMSGWYQPLFYPLINESAWFGGPKVQDVGGQWATYWLNGNVPLASLLRASGLADQVRYDLSAIVDRYVAFILEAQDPETGQLGPDPCTWPFPAVSGMRALLLAAEGSSPARASAIGLAIGRGLGYLYNCTFSGKSGGGYRWPSYLEVLADYLDVYGEQVPAQLDMILHLAATWRQTGVQWGQYYLDDGAYPVPFPHGAVLNPSHSSHADGYYHGVNANEGLKFEAATARFWRPDPAEATLDDALRLLDDYHAHPQGTFGADEFLSGRAPQRGTELCDVVEGMYTFDWTYRQLGGERLSLLDRAERLAFNGLPGTTTADLWQHQYDQQTNALNAAPEVNCGGSNRGSATVYGLQPHYPCCTVNLPQGWPKLAMGAVLLEGGREGSATPPSAFVVAHLLPINVSTPSLGALTIETDYPFGDVAVLTAYPLVDKPLIVRVRVPGWATGATVVVRASGGARAGALEEVPLLNGTLWAWHVPQGAAVSATIDLHPQIRVEAGWGDGETRAAAILRGPLLFALPIPSTRTVLRSPAAGGTCEEAEDEAADEAADEACKSSDLAFHLVPNATWNYALVLPAGDPTSLLQLSRAAPSPSVPFDPAAPPLRISASARRFSQWTVAPSNPTSAASPPPSPVRCPSPDACSEIVAITLVPFGSTQARVAAFPWIDTAEGPPAAPTSVGAGTLA